jgi:hypothetical protein
MKQFSFIVLPLILIIMVIAGGAYYLGTLNKVSQTPTIDTNLTVKAETTPSPSPSATPTPQNLVKAEGTVSADLCYPSESLPAGRIEAKNLESGELFYEKVDGTKTNIKMKLIPGKYYLRYEAHPAGVEPKTVLYGYHDGCTGSEPICLNNKVQRASIPVEVTANNTVGNVKLCDFYYGEIEPKF